jgi:hypothetical protein
MKPPGTRPLTVADLPPVVVHRPPPLGEDWLPARAEGVLAGGTGPAFAWGDFHRVFLGRGEREDLVQCHRCWLVIADEDRAAHLRSHRSVAGAEDAGHGDGDGGREGEEVGPVLEQTHQDSSRG